MPPLPTTLPVLLLPVRLETRFIDGAHGAELWVRIYPDQIAIDTHEPALTAAEQQAGEAYWIALWQAGKKALDEEKIAWRRLATAFGPQRAAWIAHVLTPINLDKRPPVPTPPNSPPQPAPDFPSVATRSSSWERPPLAVGLPDYWTVVTYVQGKETHRVTSSPVRSPLPIGMHPKPSLPAESTALQVDREMRWMVDFDEAVAAGMAVRIPITQQELSGGFERIIAIGVKAPIGPMSGAEAFSLLLHAHRYTDGLAFVPQGAPTNNTPDASSAFSRQDPGYETSFAVERQGALASAAGCNGRVVAQTLGIAPAIFDHVQYADDTDQQNAYHMALALWPATLGYFLHQMLGNIFTTEQVSLARSYFLSYVRARGPLPAFRVGQTPYGILPVSSLARWNQAAATPEEQSWISFLRHALPVWLKSAATTPRVGGSDPDADLVHILGMDASSTAYRGRYAVGANFIWNGMNMLTMTSQMDWYQDHAKRGRAVLDMFGLNTWDPLVIHTGLKQDSFPVPYPTVQDDPLSETEPLKNDWTMSQGTPGNYINWLRHASIDDIRNEHYPAPAAKPTSLLYRLLRHSVLREYATLAMDTLVRLGALKPENTKEAELVNMTAPNATVTPWDALSRPAPPVTGPSQTLAEYLESLPPTTQGPFSGLTDLRNSLDGLAKLPTAELDRLLTETLDTCSHRLDPWITSLAALLLERERRGRSTGPGVYLGGFGWVEGLSRASLRSPVSGAAQSAIQQLDEVRKARLQLQSEQRPVREPALDNGGFIHAPSLTQASVAAVLRNGYLTHQASTEGQLLALDLSSERVQTALWLLDAVRQGQSMGALLGFRFELAMHGKGLDQYIQAFRNAFPLVADKIPQHRSEPGVSMESVAATNVVDGLALERAWMNNQLPKGVDWGAIHSGLPGPGDHQNTVITIFGDLQDVMDALGDLSIAESVYQVVQGNPVRAGGLLDAVSRGESPPDPQVVRTPRAGLDVHHRLMVLLLGDVGRADGWQKHDHPRSSAEPRLDAWLTRLLPRPVRVKCQVNYTIPDGHSGVKHEMVRITLADLQVDPLDVLAMSDAADVAQSSELEQRILYTALAQIPAGANNYQISFERAADWGADDISFPQLLVLVRAVRDLVNGARPLAPQDLIEPDRQAEQFGAVVDTSELRSRANTALNALKVTIDELQKVVNTLRTAASQNAQSASDAVREQLIKVSWFGVHGSIPLSRHGADAGPGSKLVSQSDAVLKDLRKRYDDAALLNSTIVASDANPADLTALLQKVFDPSFVALPRFTPPDGNNLENTFSDSHILLANQKQALPRWLQQLTHLRPGVSRFDKAVSLARILIGQDAPGLATQLPTFTLGQLPYKKLDRWLALPLIPGAALPSSGRISLVAWITGDYEENLPHCGLLLDEWPERIPNQVASTGLTFHHEEPKARAPQTLLLACNPDSTSTNWNDDLLLAILNETLDLAKVRTVDLDTIQEVGQILPALYFALNIAQDTVSTSFAATTQ